MALQKVNALQLRQSLSKIMNKLQRSGGPIILERGRKPVAVIISLEDFKKRFVEKDADEKRLEVQRKILSLARKSAVKTSAETVLRQLRSGRIQ